jgi:hypothetical protein
MATRHVLVLLAAVLLTACGASARNLKRALSPPGGKPYVRVMYKTQVHGPYDSASPGLYMGRSGQPVGSLKQLPCPPEYESVLSEAAAGVREALPQADVKEEPYAQGIRPGMVTVHVYCSGQIDEISTKGIGVPPFEYRTRVHITAELLDGPNRDRRVIAKAETSRSPASDKPLEHADAITATRVNELAPELKSQTRAGMAAYVRAIMASE